METYEAIAAGVKKRGITNSELARRIGIPAELLRRSLKGIRKITADEFLSLCRELNMQLDDFDVYQKSHPSRH